MYPSADWGQIMSGNLVLLESGVDFPSGAAKQVIPEIKDVAKRCKKQVEIQQKGPNLIVQAKVSE